MERHSRALVYSPLNMGRALPTGGTPAGAAGYVGLPPSYLRPQRRAARSQLAPHNVGVNLAHIATLEVLAHLPRARSRLHGEQPWRLDVGVDTIPGWASAVELASLEAARLSPRGRGGAPSGWASIWECRTAQRRQARSEEAQGASSGTAKGASWGTATAKGGTLTQASAWQCNGNETVMKR